MSGATVTVPGTKGTSTLVRATFAAGMLLQHEDMERLQAYPGELSRLLFRSLLGCGVICGLVVRVEVKCGKVYLTVGAGLGLDCAGDPIHLPTDQSFALDETCDTILPDELWVILCGTVKRCAPRPAMCGSDDDEPPMVRTRERDGFEIRVVARPPACVCRCELDDYQPPEETSECWCVDPNHPCYRAHYRGECDCHCDDCGDCTGKCIVLARLRKDRSEERPDGQDYPWKTDHSVRRFIRPVLIRDPQVEAEKQAEEEEGAVGAAALAMQQQELEKPPGKATKARKARS